jgi:hypothetical protein
VERKRKKGETDGCRERRRGEGEKEERERLILHV